MAMPERSGGEQSGHDGATVPDRRSIGWVKFSTGGRKPVDNLWKAPL
ncbi:hypothetical protein B005_2001 [Nocardiopsis alba ATCC BAA-2165]|uniref:Uncharacterized protein n=1 Tax=Nocardiopsis alba (strain ATCC BAA-2165 / BE74) TaxID=1205910 RepID=J7LBM0_NOCAA|nr:hypothetical protein B005_2001 [Nocardiopsis alba ATCC BAA-2165]